MSLEINAVLLICLEPHKKSYAWQIGQLSMICSNSTSTGKDQCGIILMVPSMIKELLGILWTP